MAGIRTPEPALEESMGDEQGVQNGGVYVTDGGVSALQRGERDVSLDDRVYVTEGGVSGGDGRVYVESEEDVSAMQDGERDVSLMETGPELMSPEQSGVIVPEVGGIHSPGDCLNPSPSGSGKLDSAPREASDTPPCKVSPVTPSCDLPPALLQGPVESPHLGPPSLELAVVDNEMPMCLQNPSPGEMPPKLELALEADGKMIEFRGTTKDAACGVGGGFAELGGVSELVDPLVDLPVLDSALDGGNVFTGGNASTGGISSTLGNVFTGGNVSTGAVTLGEKMCLDESGAVFEKTGGIESNDLLPCHVALERVDMPGAAMDCTLVQSE